MEPIAIIGMGCRLPGDVSTPNQFWQLLRDGVDAVTDAPLERVELYQAYDPHASPATPGKLVTLQGGFLAEVEAFDAAFFGIKPREATVMDPQQRLLLEVAWESLEDAGRAAPTLSNRRAGVFIGMWTNDYQDMVYQGLDDLDLYATTGAGRYAASGRLSYLLDLRGPSMTIDTACSSSLVAVHLACESLRSGECSVALAGGANLILQPHLSIGYSRSRMLSPDGRCKFGDEQANGYVRSEGVAIIVLKPLAAALADRDHIYAVIRSSAVNNDGGSSESLVKPGFEAQKELIRHVYHQAGVAPGDIDYIEAHGTGTGVGDEVELQAIGAVLATERTPDNPCYVGSLKTNIGHTEGASGVAGIMKLALSLQHRLIPPSLHFKTPNTRVPWSQLPITIPRVLTPWPDRGGVAYASINSYGVTGTNAHALLQEAPPALMQESSVEERQRPYHLLTLSARSEGALKALAERYHQYLREGEEQRRLGDICFTTHVGRAHFAHRLGLVASTPEEMEQRLDAFLSGYETGTEAGSLPEGPEYEAPPKVVFFFPGWSRLHAGMASQLYESEPTFRTEIDLCTALSNCFLDRPVQWTIDSSLKDEMPALEAVFFSLEYALAKMWQSWGITPAAVCGEGAGMYVAACIAGVLQLEDALRLCIEHARLHQARQMADGAALASLEQTFTQICAALDYATPQIAVLSARTACVLEHIDAADYWLHNAQEMLHTQMARVENLEALLHGQHYTLCIEMGAGSSDEQRLEKALPWQTALSSDIPDWKQLQIVLGVCYMHHVSIDWQAFEAAFPYRRLALPVYAFQHERYRLPRVASKPARPERPDIEHSELLNRLRLVRAARKHEVIQEHVHRQVAMILGYDPALPIDPRRGFWELGLTSLMVVELQERLQSATGRPLVPTLLFDYPTIGDVSRYLAEELLSPMPVDGTTIPHVEAAKRMPEREDSKWKARLEQVRRLSEAEALALLCEEVAALEEDIRHI